MKSDSKLTLLKDPTTKYQSKKITCGYLRLSGSTPIYTELEQIY
jgi:hypothetical protein